MTGESGAVRRNDAGEGDGLAPRTPSFPRTRESIFVDLARSTAPFGQDARRQVGPVRVGFTQQLHLPRSAPFLELLFAADGALGAGVHLAPDQPDDVVTLGEAGRDVMAVLPQARHEVARHADIERAVGFRGQHVDDERLHHAV